ncbi:hypothetical protein [Quadrisphaera sp. KR29]|uniref:hypothetical protein n=1 Tax=Quadrisphaera sp. KR29 TaxID=3461391 RepID=UPI004044C407
MSMQLRVTRERRRPRATGQEAGVHGLLEHLRGGGGAPARPVPAAELPGDLTGDGLTWAADDAADSTWWPQGVAALEGGRVLLVGWYERPTGPWWRRRVPRSRVSVLDRSDPARPRYAHVELVVGHHRPLGWLRPLGAVPVHAGGLAVVAPPGGSRLLLVADTLFGLRVFALDDLRRAPTAPGGAPRWVLPQRRAVRAPLLRAGLGASRFRFSFTGAGHLGAEGPVLVSGEYRRAGQRGPGGAPRLVAHRLDPRTGLPLGAPLAVHPDQPPRMQGVALLPPAAPGAGPTWVVSASAGHERCGDLHVGAPGAWRTHRGALPPGCEDLDPADPADPRSVLWGASEHPGRRWVFPVHLPALGGVGAAS